MLASGAELQGGREQPEAEGPRDAGGYDLVQCVLAGERLEKEQGTGDHQEREGAESRKGRGTAAEAQADLDADRPVQEGRVEDASTQQVQKIPGGHQRQASRGVRRDQEDQRKVPSPHERKGKAGESQHSALGRDRSGEGKEDRVHRPTKRCVDEAVK